MRWQQRLLVIAVIVVCAGAPARAQPAPEPASDDAAKAKAAQLTPIVPQPGATQHPAFQLYAEIDLPILTIGLVFAGTRFIRTQKAFCAPLCDRGDLNALDRTTAGRWSPGWATASNAGILTLGAGAALLLVLDEGTVRALNDVVVIAESAVGATATATIMTIAAGRPRPFLYGDAAPLAERNGSDAGNSFLSSHAAVSFALATSVFLTARRLHPTARWPYAVLAAGLGSAAFIATSRVAAGQHFITDALGGALVGSGVAVLVSSVHPSPLSVVPLLDGAQHGVGVSGRF